MTPVSSQEPFSCNYGIPKYASVRRFMFSGPGTQTKNRRLTLRKHVVVHEVETSTWSFCPPDSCAASSPSGIDGAFVRRRLEKKPQVTSEQRTHQQRVSPASDPPESARVRPRLLNTERMRMVARRTPHRNKASGLDATRWCRKDRSLLRRSETTSGRMCSTLFCTKSYRQEPTKDWSTFVCLCEERMFFCEH